MIAKARSRCLNSAVPFASVNDLSLCYECQGDPSHPPLLLVAGLGVQMIDWPDHIVDPLVAAGHYVIRFDNRDAGLSTSFDGAPNDLAAVGEALAHELEPDVAYTLADMAADAVGLLDALDIDQAHVLGVSMGGMIVQTMAIMFPERVRSLISVMSTTGAADVGQPSPEALQALLTPGPDGDVETRLAHSLGVSRIWASPDHFDEAWLRSMYLNAWERVGGPQPEHQGRQLCALLASPARDEILAMVDAPTLVIHGTADTLIDPSGGERTAASIAGSQLLLIDGMGHDMPKGMADQIVGAITTHITTAEISDGE